MSKGGHWIITLLNNYTGAIEVMASGIPFKEEQYNLATQGKRNPGSAFKPIKILGDGELKENLEITASAFSTSAKEKIEKAGGTAIIQ